MIRLLYFFMALFSAAVIDLQKRIVPNWMVCLVALISIVPPGRPCLMGILAALPLFLAGITIGGIGGGDVKLVGACGLVLGLYQTVIGLILESVNSVAYSENCNYRQKRKTGVSIGSVSFTGNVY